MKYEFLDSDGNVVEITMLMRDAPSIGSIITHEGQTLTRIASTPQVDPGTNRSQYPYVSTSLPRRLEGCKATKQGKPVIMSKRHEREIMARHGFEKD
jgi:hypothetical protein